MRSWQHGMLLYLLSSLLLVGEVAATHRLGNTVSIFQLSILRNLGGLLLVMVLARNIGLGVFRTNTLLLQITRAVLTVTSMWAIFYAFVHLPLADAQAMMYTRGVFLAFLAWFILREVLDWSRSGSVVIGFLGSVIVAHPAFVGWNDHYFVALLGPFLNASAMIATKVLERQDSETTVMAYVAVISLLLSIPGVFSPWPTDLWPWLLAVMVFGTAGFYVGLVAIRMTDISVLAPLDYTRLVFSAIIGYSLFAEIPAFTSVVGVTLITLGTIWVALTSGRVVAK